MSLVALMRNEIPHRLATYGYLRIVGPEQIELLRDLSPTHIDLISEGIVNSLSGFVTEGACLTCEAPRGERLIYRIRYRKTSYKSKNSKCIVDTVSLQTHVCMKCRNLKLSTSTLIKVLSIPLSLPLLLIPSTPTMFKKLLVIFSLVALPLRVILEMKKIKEFFSQKMVD